VRIEKRRTRRVRLFFLSNSDTVKGKEVNMTERSRKTMKAKKRLKGPSKRILANAAQVRRACSKLSPKKKKGLLKPALRRIK
jgi:hypothetical protein